jgi:hypothetical protein
MDRSSTLRVLTAGLAAGVIGSAVMSVVMLIARRWGVTPELPPAEIADEAVATATGRAPTQVEEEAVAGIAHVGFGAALGVGLAAVHRLIGTPGLLVSTSLGVVYAAGVYLVSYQGWIPALRIMPPASRDDRGRVATMVVGHVVYGTVAGLVTGLLRRR